MTAQEYLASIGLGHLRAEPDAFAVKLVDGISLGACGPSSVVPAGMVWLRGAGIRSVSGCADTPAGVAKHLRHMASEAEAEAARYRAALAVLLGKAPQSVEVQP